MQQTAIRSQIKKMMEKIIELSQTEIVLAFVATCIEGAARRLGIPYQEVFRRMKNVDMINQYIIPHYELLHTESRENLIEGIIECLNNWEKRR